jgi:predicted dehydrogenase
MAPIRYGIVGAAGIGWTHATAVERATDAELVACADVDPGAAAAFADEHGIAEYTDVGEMVTDADVDAVSVCTPSGTHADVTVAAAEAGAHVLCEKPLDVYADRMDRMIDACDAAGVTLGGVFQKRFHRAAQRAKAIVEGGELGTLVTGDATVKWFRSQTYYDDTGWQGTRDLDGGVLLNQAIHSVDRLQWLAGDVESVRAVTAEGPRDMECESIAALALTFESGALGTLSATTATAGGRDRTEIDGTEGSLGFADADLVSLEVATGEYAEKTAVTDRRDVHVPADDWGEGHAAAVADFTEAVREGRDPAVPGREARKAVDVALAAYASDARGEAVAVADVRDGHVPETRAGG